MDCLVIPRAMSYTISSQNSRLNQALLRREWNFAESMEGKLTLLLFLSTELKPKVNLECPFSFQYERKYFGKTLKAKKNVSSSVLIAVPNP